MKKKITSLEQKELIDSYDFTQETDRLLYSYKRALKEEISVGPYIHVDEIASKVAAFYEKIRAVVDWKEEHLLRRTAIERGLKRRFIYEISGIRVVNGFNLKDASESLVLELVRGGHLPNNKIPREKLPNVQKILEKYIYIFGNNPLSLKNSSLKIKDKINFYNWFLEIAACEIEEILLPSLKEMVLINYMSEVMFEKIQIDPTVNITDNEKFIQIYIASQLTLFRLDNPIITYKLLKLKYPDWKNVNEKNLNYFSKNILKIQDEIKKDFEHPYANDFYIACEQYDTLFLILYDVLEELGRSDQDISDRIFNWKDFGSTVVEVYNKRLASLKTRLFKMAIFSTLSVLVASAVSLFLVEVPIAKFFYGKFNVLAIFVDILLPTFLMFILVLLVKTPGQKNLENLLVALKKIIYKNEKQEYYEIRLKRKRGFIVKLLVGFFYFLGMGTTLGFIFWIFYIAKVPITSVYVDTINVAVIVFAALLIRQKSKELLVEEKSVFWEFILDTLSVPIGRIGQWVAEKWKEYNIVSVFFTVLIDMPIQTIVGVIEDWSLFIKEKKAKLH
ncbi:hypothetical protein KJ570_03675 [Patescibacteria group bacterium]|nr:hypothetical protein [Patescibacteria group bacterium]